jgi:hypothetical protein
VRAANLSGFELVIEGVARSEPGLKAVLVVAAQIKDDHGCNKNKVVPGTGLEPVNLAAADFKSAVISGVSIYKNSTSVFPT